METQRDFSELLASFNARSVEYPIVGGYALAFHGAPRFTGDLDLLIGPGADNARRVVAALGDFGFAAGMYGDVSVHYLGRQELVNKRATGRRRDAADLEALGES